MLVCTRFSMLVCTRRPPQGVRSNRMHTPITFRSRGLRGNPKSPLVDRDTDEISRIQFTVKKRFIQVTFAWSIANDILSDVDPKIRPDLGNVYAQKFISIIFIPTKTCLIWENTLPGAFDWEHTSYSSRLVTDMYSVHTVKKRFATFPSPAGTSLSKLSLARNNLIIPDQGEFG